MSLPRCFQLAGVALAVAWSAGCSEPPAASDSAALAAFSASPRERPHHSDEYLANVADRVPGFAGFYLHDDTLVLTFKGAQAGTAASTALRQTLRDDPDMGRFRDLPRLLAEAPVEVRPARYDARELWEFRVRALRQVFAKGVHSLDQDETKGILRIGVDGPSDVGAVSKRVSGAGIPTDAVVIEVTPRPRALASLRDRLRPVPGGVRVEIEDTYAYCTLTVNALTEVTQEWGFLTNSHCTSAYGSTGDAAYQNEQAYGNVIGWEVLDPPLWSPGDGHCPTGLTYGCRYSDAAFFVYEHSYYPDSMTIARTTNSRGSTTIDGNHPRFAVSGPAEYQPIGLDVDKMGQKTGWTAGEITGTCQDVEDGGFLRFCQWVADFTVGNGDSGSPVFTWDGSSWSIELAGILSAGILSPCCTAYYSPWIYVEIEVAGELMEELLIAY